MRLTFLCGLIGVTRRHSRVAYSKYLMLSMIYYYKTLVTPVLKKPLRHNGKLGKMVLHGEMIVDGEVKIWEDGCSVQNGVILGDGKDLFLNFILFKLTEGAVPTEAGSLFQYFTTLEYLVGVLS